VLTEDPPTHAMMQDKSRRKRFIEIFSGRDGRFAILPWNLPGGGLERLLLERNDHNSDVEIWTDEISWDYPIDTSAPYDAPVLARQLFLLDDEVSECFLRPIALALLEYRTEFLPVDCVDSSLIVDGFRDALCLLTVTLIGLPDGSLAPNMPPPLTYEDLLVRVRMKKVPEEGDECVSLIGLQPDHAVG
jgi:hypothetical protein